MIRSVPWFLLPLALCLPVGQTFAEKEILLEEIVVYGEEGALNEETLTIREVRESPARDVGEALEAVEGLSIVRKGAIAGDPVLRGMKRDDVNVLIDGARLYGGCPNRMDSPAFHIDFAEVESVRIVKGPYDVENAGSLGGLVEIVTRETTRPGIGLDGSAGYGSFESLSLAGSASYGGDRFDGRFGYAYKDALPPEAGNGARLTEVYPSTHPHRYREGAADTRAYVINTLWTKWGFEPTDRSRAGLSYAYQDATHVLYPYLLMDADYDRTHRVNGSYTAESVSERVKAIEVRVFWDAVDHLMDNRYREPAVGTPTRYTMRADATTQVYGAKVKAILAAGGEGRMSLGIDTYNRTWDVDNTMFNATAGMTRDQKMIPDVETENVGFFWTYDRPLGETFSLSLGLRGDLTRVEANGLDRTRLETLFRPYYGEGELERNTDFETVSGNVQLNYMPAKGVELFAGLARGVRPPDPQELYIGLERMSSNWIGNPDLGESTNSQADLGVKLFGETFYVKGSLFVSYVDDFINVTNLPDPDGVDPTGLKRARSYANVDALLYGGELGARVSLPLDLYLSGSLAFVRAENRSTHLPLAEMPPLNGTVGIRYDRGLFFVEVAERFADRQDRVDTRLGETETAGWAVTDLKAGVRVAGASIYGGVMNLFDKYYFSHLSYQRDPFSAGVRVPEIGRYLYVTATYSF